MKVRRNSGAQQLQDHVTRFSQHCRACVSCSWPTREIFAQNLATFCALCAWCVQLEPGAAARRSGRVPRCVREKRALLHSWARWPVHRAALHIVRHGALRCRAAVQSGVHRAVCRAVCRPLQPAAAHCSCTPTPPLQ